MLLAGRDQNGVPGFDSLLTVLITNLALPFKDVDLMLPIVLMIRCETACFHSEVTHKKSRSGNLVLTLLKSP